MTQSDNEHGRYGLVLPFWIDTEAYTKRDREMFVCGAEFQMIYMAIVGKRDWNQCIHTENESRVRIMCGQLGVPCKMERYDETWTQCWIPASTTI